MGWTESRWTPCLERLIFPSKTTKTRDWSSSSAEVFQLVLFFLVLVVCLFLGFGSCALFCFANP